MGAEIKFTVGGREVSADKFGDALKDEAMKNVKAQVAERLLHIRCPEHGGTPRVTSSGSSLDSLKWEISGCCEKLREAARRALE